MADAPEKLQALVRSLNLVPYFRAHPDKTTMEAAADLGMTPAEVREGLESLFCTGVGQHTEEMLDGDASDWRRVIITEDQGLNKPLKLTPTEAGSLLLMLESLEAMPGLTDASAVTSAASKIRAIMDKKTAAIYDTLAVPDPEESSAGAVMREALTGKHKLRFDYWSQTSNTTSTRVVSPARIFIRDSEVYLVAWDDSAGQNGGHRTFRQDRMSRAEVLRDVEHQATPHEELLNFSPDDPFGLMGATRAQLAVHKEFTWLAEEYQMELGEELDNVHLAASMPFGSVEWLARLALAYGDVMTVLGPPEAVAAIAEKRVDAQRRYTEQTSNYR
ncbi:WYL domain-containing protein [Corynebacterium incognita]|uniref:WYL domain-containing protein n=1 Tax=Corynebacterium incognita TaxID=2754725 RepID=A0A7G7CPN9_9CORY|nr:WYL domain-containing protein [Corynebacterium incognita]QNE89555.1 WYL domain-containing protein [Corynebacterium incognita]